MCTKRDHGMIRMGDLLAAALLPSVRRMRAMVNDPLPRPSRKISVFDQMEFLVLGKTGYDLQTPLIGGESVGDFVPGTHMAFRVRRTRNSFALSHRALVRA